jgi:AcrR family transcriptional regulator
MANYKKGIETRSSILNEARKVFNEEGIRLTLDQLAGKLSITKGRITNYFPNKDHIFVALSQDYDNSFIQLLSGFNLKGEMTFQQLAFVYSAIMDLQYEFRSAIVFVATTSSAQIEMHSQITSSYKINNEQMESSIRVLVDNGLVQPEILEEPNFEIFRFQIVNLFTTWIISLEIYYSGRPYNEMKPIYLKGILNCFYPYLTKKGMQQMSLLEIPK